ncbi:probable RNA-binding protein 19 [Oncorhynchus kisutch]|uniref:probable RNA-binding protein 19 n=1 Tax=Oncorhynchus kisutch TaxID=8019 RepID=UPI0012DE4C83|nr:probable RNA-binding protein 19 [Oncorhynchus kisutch]
MGFDKELEGDEAFQEFTSVHHNRSQLPTWANDSLLQSAAPETGQGRSQEKKKKLDYLNFESDEKKKDEDVFSLSGANKEALKSGLSDMEYLWHRDGTEFTVKLRECPFNVKEQQVREFMTTLKPAAIRIIKNATGSKTEYMYVDLRSEEEVKKSLKKNKDYMGENQTVCVCAHVRNPH